MVCVLFANFILSEIQTVFLTKLRGEIKLFLIDLDTRTRRPVKFLSRMNSASSKNFTGLHVPPHHKSICFSKNNTIAMAFVGPSALFAWIAISASFVVRASARYLPQYSQPKSSPFTQTGM